MFLNIEGFFFCIVPLIGSVIYQRFHCTYKVEMKTSPQAIPKVLAIERLCKDYL